MAFPATPLDVVVQLALGADLTENPGLWSWTDVTDYVHEPAAIVVQRGRPDEFSTAPPSQIRLTLINNDGRFCPKNPVGAYYGTINRNTPLRVRVNNGSGYQTQALGFVDQWPVSWADKSENLCLAPITASGLLRRLGQSGAQRSALYRAHARASYVDGSSIVGYWPCEDAAGSRSIASGIGGRAATMTGAYEDFAADSDIPGSAPLMQLVAGVSFVGYCKQYTSTGETAIRAIVKIPAAPGSTIEVLRWWTSGSFTVWTVEVVPGSPDRMFLRAYSSLGVEQLGGTGIDFETSGPGGGSMYGMPLSLQVNLTENAGAIDWSVTVWHTFLAGSGSGATDTGTEAASTVGTLEAIGSHNHSIGAGGTTLGHIAVASDTNYATDPAACTGYGGHRVSTRWTEIGDQLDVATDKLGSLADHLTYVGASDATDSVELFRELETAEQGVMFDGKEGYLTLKMREDRHNQAVALTLNHDAGQVDLFAPTDDDQQLRNDVTVSRPNGSAARAFDSAHIAANGNYATSADALLAADTDLPDHASWLVHLGTVEELRYPTVGLCLTRSTSKIDAWLACDIGGRIQITNPPAGLPPDTVDLHIEGYTEYLRSKDWRVELNCSPASPWQVFALEDASLGRPDTTGSSLLVAYNSAATSLLVANTAAPRWDTSVVKWSTTAEPYDWNIAGERITATAVVTQTPAFVAPGTAAHADNAAVSPSLPAGVQTGDLLLTLAADRNTAATLASSGSYTTLAQLGNLYLFGKIHSGTESAPTITPTGGSAGDTVSAQMAAFRYTQARVITTASQTNGSAQDIAIPGLPGVDRDGSVIIWMGQKADDCTSVATIAGGFATEIGEATTTTGNDQTIVWDYLVQGTVAEPGATSFVVTGGASAVSKAIVISLAGDVQAATVTRSVNGVSKSQALGAAVSLWKPGVVSL